jgi:hypothetical protein
MVDCRKPKQPGGTAMPKHGTAPVVGGAYIEFQAAVLRSLPRRISDRTALIWAHNEGERLRQFLSILEDPPLPMRGSSLPIKDLKLVPFLEPGDVISRGELVGRAQEAGVGWNREDAEFLFGNLQYIPESFRRFVLVLPIVDKWGNPGGFERISVLYWVAGLSDRWFVERDYTGNEFCLEWRFIKVP